MINFNRIKTLLFNILVRTNIMESPFITHREFLIKELNKLGNFSTIFEFGIGYGSSKIFYKYALKNPSWSISGFETNYDWFVQIQSKYKLNNYIIYHLSNYEDLSRDNLPNIIDLAFIDQEPWDSRILIMQLIAPISKTIILHDFNYYCGFDKVNKQWDLSFFQELFPNFILNVYDKKYPGTLILKNNSLINL